MVWKGTNIPAGTKHEVGFGIHCGTVLAWYCPNKPNPHDEAKRNPRLTLKNVCRDDGSCANADYICTKDGYDSCYNKMALEKHNSLRTDHCADTAYESDKTMAIALQNLLNANKDPSAKRTAPKDRPKDYQKCFESLYQAPGTVTDAAVKETNLATDAWYARQSDYDFALSTGRSTPTAGDDFTAIVWKGIDGAAANAGAAAATIRYRVAFAVRFKHVLAWYCPLESGKMQVNSLGNYGTNVVAKAACVRKCKDDYSSDKFYKCYQDEAVKAHNEKRRVHGVPEFKIDYDLAKEAQYKAENYVSTMKRVTKDPSCYMNYWNTAKTSESKDAKAAVTEWYKTGTNYIWEKIGPQVLSDPFTAMIWRSSSKAGFGYSGNNVVALYCNTRGNDDGRYACNVCRAGGCPAGHAQECPLPAAVCSSDLGEANAEVSVTGDNMRIIATVKKEQSFTLSLGSEAIVNQDLLLFTAGKTAATSSMEDAVTSNSALRPGAKTTKAIYNLNIKEIQQGRFIRFDLTRALTPGASLPNRYQFVKGKTHTIGFRHYATNNFAATDYGYGTCSLSLSHLKPQQTGCSAAKRDSTTDPTRQQDCSPNLQQSCYNANTYHFDNNKCPAGNSCARWIETRPGGGSFYLDGCLLTQYCSTTGNYKGKTVRFDCPNPAATLPLNPPPTAGPQGTRCTL